MIDHRDASESRFYGYDELDRLWKATDLSGSPRVEYVYDAAGNRTSLVTAAGTTMTNYESGTDRIAQQTGATPKHYAHDAFGNRIYAGVAPYTGSKSHLYDQSNRLVELRDPGASTTLATYTYDAFGRRVKKTVAGQTTLFFYDSEGHVIEQLAVNPSGDDTAEDFVWVEDEPMGLVRWTKEVGSGGGGGSGTPAFYWIHTDQLATPLAMTDTPATPASAKTVWRASHEPFGLAAVQTDPDGDGTHVSLDLRFPGQIFDAESGLHQNFYRDYDPSTGRYLEPDPMLQDGYDVSVDRPSGEPLLLTRTWVETGPEAYVYGGGNPVSADDPLGLFHCVAGANCDGLRQRTVDALQCFDRCTRRDTAITCGADGHGSSDPHTSGDAVDIGRNSNRGLDRPAAEQCFYECFDRGSSYGQEEGNRGPGTHFHFQLRPGRNGGTGFAPGVQPHGR